MKKIQPYLIALTLIFVLTSCQISENEDLIEPGYLKVYLSFEGGSNELQNARLLSRARDFTIFTGSQYATFFQSPEQYLADEDSLKWFNLFEDDFYMQVQIPEYNEQSGKVEYNIDSVFIPSANKVQVAHGALSPGHYDKLIFQFGVSETLNIPEVASYPVVSKNEDLNISVSDIISTSVEIENDFQIESGVTKSLHIKFNRNENVYRIVNQFVFNAKVSDFIIENE